jgi:plastocyanin
VDEAEIRIYDGHFEPAVVLVTPGATIKWVNHGNHAHTVTDLAGTWTSKDLLPGGSYTHKLTHALHHYYYCRHHRLTMSGTIHVQARDAITGPPAPPSKGAPGGYTSPPGGSPGYRPGY